MATVIQIKRSANVAAPLTTDLAEGELAYSYDKNNDGAGAKLYVEVLDSGDSPVIHEIGGKYYTDLVDNATNSNTASTLVKRDANGDFSANAITASEFYGNITGSITGEADSAVIANTANTLTTARTITLTGDLEGSASFDGSQNISINANVISNSVTLGTDTEGDYVGNVTAGTGITTTGTPGEGWSVAVGLATSGVSAGHYGGATQIPSIEVDAQGRITSASNVAVSTAITLAADSGAGDTLNNGDVLRVAGGTGIDTTVTDNTITVALETSGVSADTYGGASAVPVITVDAQGRITSAANVSVAGVSSFTASGNSFTIATADGGSFTANIQENSVRLGTDTTGAYVGNLVAGTGISLSGLGDEGATPTITLNNTAVTPSTYGGAASVGVFTVDQQGRLTAASNVSIAIPASALTTDVALGSGTSGAYVANLVAGTGITITGLGDEGTTPTITNAGVTQVTGTANEIEVSAGTGSVTIGLPDDVSIAGDLSVTGNLNILGNVTSIGATTLVVNDPLLHLANTNTSSDIVDIGFEGHYFDATFGQRHAGLFRDASDNGKFKLFANVSAELEGATTVDTSDVGYTVATLVANLTGGTVSGLATAIAVADGGTGAGTFTTNGVLYGQGTSALAVATGTAGQVLQLNGSGVPVFGGLDGGTY